VLDKDTKKHDAALPKVNWVSAPEKHSGLRIEPEWPKPVDRHHRPLCSGFGGILESFRNDFTTFRASPDMLRPCAALRVRHPIAEDHMPTFPTHMASRAFLSEKFTTAVARALKRAFIRAIRARQAYVEGDIVARYAGWGWNDTSERLMADEIATMNCKCR
jgi:hypothetical protein